MPIDYTTRTPFKAQTKGRVDFDIEQFRILMHQKGLPVEWTQTAPCPCAAPSTEAGLDIFDVADVPLAQQSTASCSTCGGSGLIRYNPQEIKVLIQENRGQNLTREYGTNLEAETKITLLPEHLPSFGDVFKLKNSVILRSEKVVKPAAALVPLGYEVAPRVLDLAAGEETREIVAVFINDATGANSFELDKANYTFDAANNAIRFLAGIPGTNIPVEGQEFTIVYYTHPEYVVTSYPHSIRDTFTFKKGVEKFEPMPIQCYARLETR